MQSALLHCRVLIQRGACEGYGPWLKKNTDPLFFTGILSSLTLRGHCGAFAELGVGGFHSVRLYCRTPRCLVVSVKNKKNNKLPSLLPNARKVGNETEKKGLSFL